MTKSHVTLLVTLALAAAGCAGPTDTEENAPPTAEQLGTSTSELSALTTGFKFDFHQTPNDLTFNCDDTGACTATGGGGVDTFKGDWKGTLTTEKFFLKCPADVTQPCKFWNVKKGTVNVKGCGKVTMTEIAIGEDSYPVNGSAKFFAVGKSDNGKTYLANGTGTYTYDADGIDINGKASGTSSCR